MINFDDLGKRINETFESVSSMAGKSLDVQKLKNQIRNLERGNDHDMESLGRTIYQDFLSGKITDEKAKELCEAIKGREEAIDEALEKIQKIKGELHCPACDKQVTKDMSFCPSCGAKQPEPSVAEDCDCEVKDCDCGNEETEATETEGVAEAEEKIEEDGEV